VLGDEFRDALGGAFGGADGGAVVSVLVVSAFCFSSSKRAW
jgi:hypothetical protein